MHESSTTCSLQYRSFVYTEKSCLLKIEFLRIFRENIGNADKIDEHRPPTKVGNLCLFKL